MNWVLGIEKEGFYNIFKYHSLSQYLLYDVHRLDFIGYKITNLYWTDYIASKIKKPTYSLFKTDCVTFANDFIQELFYNDWDKIQRMATENYFEKLLREVESSGNTSWFTTLYFDFKSFAFEHSDKISFFIFNMIATLILIFIFKS